MIATSGSSESLRARVWQGIGWTASGESVVAVLRVLTVIWLARLLTPAEFGVMTAALVVVEFSRIFVYMGFGPAIVQLPRLSQQHLSTALLASVVFGLAVQILVLLGAPWIAAFFESPPLEPVLRVLSFVFPIRSLSMVAQSLLQRDLRFREIAKVDVLAFVIGFAPVALGGALMGAGTWALVWGYLVNAGILTTGYLFLVRPRRFWSWDKSALRDLLRFGSGITLARFAGYFAGSSDNLVVGRMLGITALGLYGRAYGLMSSTVKVTVGVLDKVLFSAIARVQGDRRRLRKGFSETQTAVAFGMLPASAVLMVLAPETIYLMLGSQWMAAVPIFQILAAGLLFHAGHRVALSVAGGTGAVYRLAGVQVFYGLAVLVGAIIGQNWGLEGVAVGVLLAVVVGYAVAARVALSIVELGWLDFLKMHRMGLTTACTVFLATWLPATALRWYNAPSVVVFAASVLTGGSVWLLFARRVLPDLLGAETTAQIRVYLKGRRYGRGHRHPVGASE